jgi:hypothetical protein
MGPVPGSGSSGPAPHEPPAPKRRNKLLETLEEADGSKSAASASKKRRLKRRDTEEKVDRLLGAHFKDFTVQDTDGTTRNGLTLRQTLLEELREKAQGGRISQVRIKQLRSLFMSQEDPIRSLVIKDPEQAFNKDLLSALAKGENANPAKRSHQLLYAYLDTTPGLNQKEYVVLLRSIVGSSPASSVALRKHILELLKAVVRLGLHTKFVEETKQVKRVFDDTLALTWSFMKAGGMAMDAFWEAYGHLAAPLGCHAEMSQIFAEEGTFTHVKDQIIKVVAMSSLGAKLFGNAATMLKVEDFSAQVDAEIAKLKQKAKVSEPELKDMKDHQLWQKKLYYLSTFVLICICYFLSASFTSEGFPNHILGRISSVGFRWVGFFGVGALGVGCMMG